jgi:anti-sigma-K factor RskA
MRRRRTPAWIASAAAAGVVVGGLGGTWLATRDDAPAPAVLAQAELEALPGWDAVGHAEIEEDADGRRVLVLTVAENDDPAETGGLREVWLLKEDVSGLVSLGLLDGEEGRFLVPDGVDLTEYPVVDVSREPTDGDPAHSGDSIVRGLLAGGPLGA